MIDRVTVLSEILDGVSPLVDTNSSAVRQNVDILAERVFQHLKNLHLTAKPTLDVRTSLGGQPNHGELRIGLRYKYSVVNQGARSLMYLCNQDLSNPQRVVLSCLLE